MFSLRDELRLFMSCILIIVFKRLKRVENDLLDLNKNQFMKKDSEKNDILHNNAVLRIF